MTHARDEVRAGAPDAVQLRLLEAGTAMLALIDALAPQLSGEQAEALTRGMRTEGDAPALLLELRAAGPRVTVLAFDRGTPVELAELVLRPVELPDLGEVA
jgi:hypothetical protein